MGIALFIDTVMWIKGIPFIILFAIYISSEKVYEDDLCFKCPACHNTDDLTCFRTGDVDTCQCALAVGLRTKRPEVPYGQEVRFCGTSACDCTVITGSSPQYNPSGAAACIYYAPDWEEGNLAPNISIFAVVFMSIDLLISFISWLYWFMVTIP